jgi:formylglycine-generating enzyme required for sulfatase activity
LSFLLTVAEPLGERQFVEADFPLALGGAGATVVLPAAPAGVRAWLGLHDGRPYLQAAADEAELLHNGTRVQGSVWLRAGDAVDVDGGRVKLRGAGEQWTLEVLDGVAANLTAPPLVEQAATIAGAAAAEETLEPIAFTRTRTPAPATSSRRSWRGPAVGLGLLLLAGLALLLFTAVPVQVQIEPDPQRVAFEGDWPALRLGSSFLLRPGRYQLVAERAGYAPLRTTVVIGKERNQRIARRLSLLPGIVVVELPVPGRVVVDGKPLGAAPGEFELAAGRHALLIDTERHLDYTTELQVEGGGKRQTLRPTLVPGWGKVAISSEPGAAEVLVGGQSRGRTPLELELMAGNHRVELRLPGFRDWVSDVQVKANTPLAIGPVRLGIPDGTLLVRSEPAGARVSVGGVYRGRTPLQIEVRPEVPQAVEFTRDGYEPASREASVASGATATVSASLVPILGEVIVAATPADADLYVDGRASGKARQTLRLPATAHTLEIRKPGYATHRVTVTPRPKLPQNIEVTLLEGVTPALPPTDAATGGVAAGAGVTGSASAAPATLALQPTLRAKGGPELKLVPAGEYTMGSPRREAGRRANESQRPVRLERRFYVSPREITNAEFKQFRPEHRSGFIGQQTLELERQPVVNVSWQDAAAYANWLSAQEGLPPAYVTEGGRLVPAVPATTGYRLPTEAEWEWIARSTGGGLRKYPWGDALPVPAGAGNFADRTAQPLVPLVLADLDDGYPASAPAGSFAANALGFFDLGGNVAEWTQDLYTVQPPASAAAADPAALGAGNVHVIRGSSWKHSAVTELRLAYRDYGDGKRNDLGFRIARYAQ